MKKITAIVSALVMAFLLVSCGGGAKSPAVSRSTASEDGRTLSNRYTGITVTLPRGWEKYDDALMADAYFGGITAEEMHALTAEDFSAMEVIYDVIAMDGKGNNVIVFIENAQTVLDKAGAEITRENAALQLVENTAVIFENNYNSRMSEVEIGGLTYRMGTIKNDDSTQHLAIRALDETYCVNMIFTTASGHPVEYLSDMLSGGVKTASPENVPGRAVYNETLNRITNETTGIFYDAPAGWEIATEERTMEYFYGDSTLKIDSFSPEQWAGIGMLPDFMAYDSENGSAVDVRYINIKASPEYYCMSVDEIVQNYIDDANADGRRHAMNAGEMELFGRTFSTVKHNEDTEDENSAKGYLAFARLNEDYVAIIRCITREDATARKVLSALEKENDVETAMKPGTYDSGTKHFYNEVSGIGLTVPEGWRSAPLEESLLDYLYNREGKESFLNGSEADFNWLWAIADFCVVNDETGAEMYVYYVNKNHFTYEGVSEPEAWHYMESQKDSYTQNGWTVKEGNYSYSLSGHSFMMSYFERDGVENILACADINEDYIAVLDVYTGNPAHEQDTFWMMLDIVE